MTTNIEKLPSENELTALFKVTIPGSLISSKVRDWLLERSKTVFLSGFRKGKVPLKTVEALYKDQAIAEIVQTFSDEAYHNIVSGHPLRPAAAPERILHQPYDHATQSDLVFDIKIINFPEVVLKDFGTLSLDRIQVMFDETEIDQAAEKYSREKTFLVEAPLGHKVQETDVVLLSLKSSLGKNHLKDYSAKSIRLPIVTKREKEGDVDVNESLAFVDSVMISCLGRTKDEEFVATHTFPVDFKEKSLAGQTVHIDIKISGIEENKSFPVGEELAKHAGFDTVESFRNDLREKIQKEYDSIARIYHKRRLLDALSTEYPLSVPQMLIDREFENIWARLKEETKDMEWDEETSEENMRKEYYAIADRRVRLGLVIGQVSKDQKINISDDMVRRAIWEEVSRSPWNERKIIKYYESQPPAVAYLRSSLLEDVVVNEILTKITPVDVILTPEELKERMKDVLPGFGDEDNVGGKI